MFHFHISFSYILYYMYLFSKSVPSYCRQRFAGRFASQDSHVLVLVLAFLEEVEVGLITDHQFMAAVAQAYR